MRTTSLYLFVTLFIVGAFLFFLCPSCRSFVDSFFSHKTHAPVHTFPEGTFVPLSPEIRQLQRSMARVSISSTSSVVREVRDAVSEVGVPLSAIADEISDTCHISVSEHDVIPLLSRAYAAAGDTEIDLEELAAEVKKNGLGAYTHFLNVRYGISPDDAKDYLCVAASATIRKDMLKTELSAEEVLKEFDTTLPELQELLSTTCSRDFTKGEVYDMLNTFIENVPHHTAIRAQEWTSANFISHLASAMKMSTTTLTQYICAR